MITRNRPVADAIYSHVSGVIELKFEMEKLNAFLDRHTGYASQPNPLDDVP
jgi:hypothetical protein